MPVDNEQDVVRVKRSSLHDAVNFVRHELGDERADALIAASAPADARILNDRGGLVSEMVPVGVVNRLVTAAATAKGEDLDIFARRLGRSKGGVIPDSPYKYLLASRELSSFMSKVPVMWKLLYDRGELVVAELEKGKAKFRLDSFPAEQSCCARITGMTEGYLEAMGLEDVHASHTRCRLRGAPACEWDARWRADPAG